MEYWDLVDSQGNTKLSNHRRGDEIPAGLYHQVVTILVQHQDGSILIMQRDWNKEILPGKFEATAGGSLLQGETVEEGAKRELLEETGLQVDTLIPVRRYLDSVYPLIWTNYFTQVNVNKSQITLQAGETIAFEWISLEAFIRRVEQKEIIPLDASTLETYYLELLQKKEQDL